MIGYNPKKLRHQYLLQYFLVITVVAVGSIYAIYGNYSVYKSHVISELQREVHITESVMDDQIADANQMLDFVRPQIINAIFKDKLTDEAVYQIFRNARTNFDPYINTKSLRLLFYADENGVIRATNEGIVAGKINIADRLYFERLKEKPDRIYSLGNVLTAKTTGLLTFHVANPIVGEAGQFLGIVTQQIVATELGKALEKSLDGLTEVSIFVDTGNGDLLFNYPVPPTLTELDEKKDQFIDKLIADDAKQTGLIEDSGSKLFSMGSILVYTTSSRYGFQTSAIISKAVVINGFMKESASLILYSLLALLALTIIMYGFYRNAKSINLALLTSFEDPLTGLKNRRGFDADFPMLRKDAFRSRQPISVLFLDIDHFKIFNDDYGHERGDIALVAVARAITKHVSRPLDLCCRWGGEEFAIALPQTDERGAILLANKILASVRSIRFDFPRDQHPKITISIGIATAIISDTNETDDLVDMADKAMYVAKKNGRDQYAVFNQQICGIGESLVKG